MRHRTSGGLWETTTWAEYLLGVRQVAGGLAELGLKPGSRVAILSANRPEWHLADHGTLANGSVTVPIYPTSSPSQIGYVLDHAGVNVCFVDTHAQLGKVLDVCDDLPGLRRIVLTDWPHRAGDTFVISFDELRARGADRIDRDPAAVDDRCQWVRPEDLATIVYTSGTTGLPKGALVTHGNVMWTLRSATLPYGIGEGDRLLSFLPLSHVAERMMSDFMPVAVTGETWFARGLATVAEDLVECRPTVFFAVPRVWEKLRDGIEDRLYRQPPLIRAAVARYVALGLRKVDAGQGGLPLTKPLELTYQALDRTIGSTIRRDVGLDHARLVLSAAAPIHPDLIRWFHAIGLPLLQIYGQTEGCGPTTATRPDHVGIGTVGTVLPGMTVKMAADGEILVKGGNVCRGYLDDPGATAELIDDEGWMHSGDTGAFDLDGSLRLVGRKKDLIITAAGKNVSPQPIETDLRNQPLVSEAVVAGEGRKYLTALITLDHEELIRWAERHSKLDDLEALAQDPDVVAEVQAAVDDVNDRRSHAEHIRKFRILPHELTGAAGELTPTMKVKRSVVYERYGEVIDELYAGR
jgi:long-chain acyl-CoA synthetase